jgi:hypothetical protein
VIWPTSETRTPPEPAHSHIILQTGNGKERHAMQWDRIFGGNPLGVIIRLVVLSIVVGIVLSALGISFDNLFWRLQVLAQRIYGMGWGAVEWAVQYFLLGAVIVVPIWLIARLAGGARRRDDRPK